MSFRIHFSSFMLLLLFSVWSASAHATKCVLALALSHNPELNRNSSFWEDVAALSDIHSGDLPAEDFHGILNKYKVSTEPSGGSSSKAKNNGNDYSLRDFSFTKEADKEYGKLPSNLQKKFDEFLDQIIDPDGLLIIRNNPGKWHYEKMVHFGDHAHSVRLNNGYRILFDIREEGNVVIRRINKGQIHSN